MSVLDEIFCCRKVEAGEVDETNSASLVQYLYCELHRSCAASKEAIETFNFLSPCFTKTIPEKDFGMPYKTNVERIAMTQRLKEATKGYS